MCCNNATGNVPTNISLTNVQSFLAIMQQFGVMKVDSKPMVCVTPMGNQLVLSGYAKMADDVGVTRVTATLGQQPFMAAGMFWARNGDKVFLNLAGKSAVVELLRVLGVEKEKVRDALKKTKAALAVEQIDDTDPDDEEAVNCTTRSSTKGSTKLVVDTPDEVVKQVVIRRTGNYYSVTCEVPDNTAQLIREAREALKAAPVYVVEGALQ